MVHSVYVYLSCEMYKYLFQIVQSTKSLQFDSTDKQNKQKMHSTSKRKKSSEVT